MYTGPIVLYNVLPVEVYYTFLLFFVAIFCLASPSNCVSYCNHSITPLINFVNHFTQFYGKENAIYIVHYLIHLPEDGLKGGHLDQMSVFLFENDLYKLKNLIRKPQYTVAHVIRRISERDAVCTDNFADKKIYFKKEHSDGPKPSLFGSNAKQYKEVYLPGFCSKVSSGNNCVKIGKDIGLAKNIITVDDVNYVVY